MPSSVHDSAGTADGPARERRSRIERRQRLVGSLIGILGAALVISAGRLVFAGLLQIPIPSAVFLTVVVAAAWYGGWRPGLVATLACLLGMGWLLYLGKGSLTLEPRDQAQIATFVVVSLFVILLADKLHEGRRRVELKHRQLLTEAERNRQMTLALRENEERLRLAMEGGRMGTWDADLRTGKVIWSPQHFDLFGYPRAPGGQASCEMWTSRVHPDDRAAVDAAAERARRDNTRHHTEYRIVRADTGQVRWICASGRYHYDERGEPVRSVGIAFDITDRKHAEEQLQRIGWMLQSAPGPPPQPQPYGDMAQLNSRRQLADAAGGDVLHDIVRDYLELLQTSAAVYERNGDYALRSFASGWCRFMDAASRDLCGTAGNAAAAASGKWHCHESCWEAARLSMQTGQPVDMECRGGIRLYAVPIRAGNVPVGSMNFGYGDPPTDPLRLQALAERYAVSVEELATRAREYASRPPFVIEQAKQRLRGSARLLGEIVQRRRLESELQRRLHELAAADRRKDEFLATLAHELRNPLAPIRNALELLKAAPADPVRIGVTRDMMERQVRQMVRLIDDLLDVSRITRNKLELRKERADLRTIVQQAVESSRPLIEASQHRLALELPAERIELEADPVRLGQVFLNLLNNAAKYMEPGGLITLTAQQAGEAAVVRVRDEGIGLSPEMLPRIFEAFYQAERSVARSQGGLGIGLMLAQRLVDLHGGSITAHSAGLGRGTELVVRLPVAPAATPASGPEPPEAGAAAALETRGAGTAGGHRHTVLVVDDNEDAADSLAMLLELAGHRVSIAHEGHAGVALAARERPEVIVCDIGLPGMTGYEVARELRREPWGQRLTLVALTGWGQAEDRRRSSEAGFDHHLVKPVDPAALTELLAHVPPPDRLRPLEFEAG